jgi:hypothetical protein
MKKSAFLTVLVACLFSVMLSSSVFAENILYQFNHWSASDLGTPAGEIFTGTTLLMGHYVTNVISPSTNGLYIAQCGAFDNICTNTNGISNVVYGTASQTTVSCGSPPMTCYNYSFSPAVFINPAYSWIFGTQPTYYSQGTGDGDLNTLAFYIAGNGTFYPLGTLGVSDTVLTIYGYPAITTTTTTTTTTPAPTQPSCIGAPEAFYPLDNTSTYNNGNLASDLFLNNNLTVRDYDNSHYETFGNCIIGNHTQSCVYNRDGYAGVDRMQMEKISPTFNSSKDMTYLTWLKIEVKNPSTWDDFLFTWHATITEANIPTICIFEHDLHIYCYIGNGVNQTAIVSTSTLSYDQWYFFALRISGNIASMFINGSFDNSVSFVGLPASSNQFCISPSDELCNFANSYTATNGYIARFHVKNCALGDDYIRNEYVSSTYYPTNVTTTTTTTTSSTSTSTMTTIAGSCHILPTTEIANQGLIMYLFAGWGLFYDTLFCNPRLFQIVVAVLMIGGVIWGAYKKYFS